MLLCKQAYYIKICSFFLKKLMFILRLLVNDGSCHDMREDSEKGKREKFIIKSERNSSWLRQTLHIKCMVSSITRTARSRDSM